MGSENSDTREGVCIGMSEIIATASKTQLVDFVQHCLPSIRRALVDSESEVREAAAHAFDMLHHHLGPKAVDEVLPALLHWQTCCATALGKHAALPHWTPPNMLRCAARMHRSQPGPSLPSGTVQRT